MKQAFIVKRASIVRDVFTFYHYNLFSKLICSMKLDNTTRISDKIKPRQIVKLVFLKEEFCKLVSGLGARSWCLHPVFTMWEKLSKR